MHLTLSPQMGLLGQSETIISVAGDVLTIDGVDYDCSDIAEGGEQGWPDSHIIGPVTRTDGVIHATVLTVLGETAKANQPTSPWIISDAVGDVEIPADRHEVIAE